MSGKAWLLFLIAVSVVLPGPVHAGRESINLSGEWKLQPGEQEPAEFKYTVRVPGLADMAAPALDLKKDRYFWYMKEFEAPASSKGRRAFIKIDQSQFGTDVYLNGKKLGSYYGCYTSHEYDAGGAINYGGVNRLLVRVGAKETLKEDQSAVGIDWERVSWIPGIWGDARAYFTGDIKIESVQMIPKIGASSAVARVTLKNLGKSGAKGKASVTVTEKLSGKKSGYGAVEYALESGAEMTCEAEIKIEGVKLWSPETPFLYEASVVVGGSDDFKTSFGMREFKVDGKHFYLNGKRIVLKGSNIAFHRFLSDSDRKGLVWDAAWIKKALVDIPKAHNFNFFRNHIGQMYNKWYDIADEGGIMLQDEWPFWSWPNGSKETIRAEFTQWLKDNWNHPSIIIWDAANESNYDKPERLPMIDYVRYELVSEMKKLDPTRPWEPTDFEEIHPYIYSEHSLLGIPGSGGGLNYMGNIQSCKTPVALNEYPWFWIDKNGKPSNLTGDVVPRWMGRNVSHQQLLEFQAFLAQELTELWRRMDADEIAPFVYISVNEGATSHWFNGDIKNLEPKPILAALKNAFAPLGVSIELWDRHFFAGEKRKTDVYIFNDSNAAKENCLLECRLLDSADNDAAPRITRKISMAANSRKVEAVEWELPLKPGKYLAVASVYETGKEKKLSSVSKKAMHVFSSPVPSADSRALAIMTFDPKGELTSFLGAKGFKVSPFDPEKLRSQDMLIAGPGALSDPKYAGNIAAVTGFVKSGKTLIVSEPESGVSRNRELDACEEITLSINPQAWRGGESYLFANNADAPVWKNIGKEDLKVFNGGWGGEAVPAFDIEPPMPFKIEAACGKALGLPALFEMRCGNGIVAVSRLQLSGRLSAEAGKGSGLYDHRPDPVLQQYLFNLIETFRPGSEYIKSIYAELDPESRIIRKVRASTSEGINRPANVLDSDKQTRWSSLFSDPQWIAFDFGKNRDVHGLKLFWETAYAKEYKIQISQDDKAWQTVFSTSKGSGGEEFIKFGTAVNTRFLRIYSAKRGTDWGCSLWEVQVFSGPKELPDDKPMVSEPVSNPLKPANVTASSEEKEEHAAGFAVDGDSQSRWSSMSGNDDQWIILDFGRQAEMTGVKLSWETAFASEYEVQASDDGDDWESIYRNDRGGGGLEEIKFKKPVKRRYLKIACVKRATPYGYSLWEIEVFGR